MLTVGRPGHDGRSRSDVKPLWVALVLTTAIAAPTYAETPKAEHGATLTVWNRPIVVFRATVREMRPTERAALAAQRIHALPDDVRAEDIKAEPLTLGDLHGVGIFARERGLFGIAEGDIDPSAGETLAGVSTHAVEQLRAVIGARADQRRPAVIARGVGLSLVATLLLVLVVWLAYRASDRALARLARASARRGISMLGAAAWSVVEGFRRACVRLTAWGVALVAAYLWLTFVLHAFPYTRPWSDRLGEHLGDLVAQLGAGALGAMPGLFAVVLIFLITRGVVRLVNAAFQSVENGALKLGNLHPDTARATRRIAGTLIWIFALTIAYPYIPGSDSDAFRAIGVFAGLVVSLGSASFVSHVMGGLVVAYARAVRVGEVVQAGDIVGRVTEVGLLSTRLVTPRREEITIPNGTLAGLTVTNYSRLAGGDGIVIATTVTIGYAQPWRQVHSLLQLAAERTPNVRKEPKPTVVQRALSDFYVQYELRAHIDDSVDRSRALSDLHAQIQDAFNEFGVQIMSPAFESQPDGAVVVPRARWFAAPAHPPDASRAGS